MPMHSLLTNFAKSPINAVRLACRPLLLLGALVCPLLCAAQAWPDSASVAAALRHTAEPADTILTARLSTRFSRKIDRWAESRLYRMTYIGVPLVAGGLIVKSEDDHFRSLRNHFLPQFRNHADDYLQYVPMAVMLGMKTAGVESRRTWGGVMLGSTFSAVLMGGTVNALKYSARVERPDGSNRRSFPSGHTATAFMTATMLSKEYGHKSPWVSVGAYSLASATGLMRMANNKHWLSDVLAGAGIGILTTEMGYFLADLIVKSRADLTPCVLQSSFDSEAPHFVSLYFGINVPLSHYDIDETSSFRTSSGATVGMEGAWFASRYVGVGGRLAVSEAAVVVNGESAEDNPFKSLTAMGGAYLRLPVSGRWSVESKLLAGFVRYPSLDLTAHHVPPRNGLGFGSGLAFVLRLEERLGVRFFTDYNLMPAHSRQSGEYMHSLTCGASVALML